MADLEALTEVELKWMEEILPKILHNGKLVKSFKPEKENTFKINDIELEFISLEEAFMATVCYRAKVNFEYDNEKITSYFVIKKTPEMPPDYTESMNFDALFGNEIHTYENIIPAMEKYTGEKYPGPKTYFSENRKHFASLVMDDFARDNWCMPKKRYDLSLEHALKAIGYLGKFHGTVYAWKIQKPVEVQELISKLEETRFKAEIPHPAWVESMTIVTKRIIKSTKKIYKSVDEKFLNTFNELIADFYSFAKNFVKPEEPLAILCHGDYLRNNIAFKYDGEEPIDVMMFDLQTMRYSSPMIDLSTFLSLSTFASVRHTHFKLIFNTYVDALSKQYKKLTKSETPEFLSKENLLTEYTRFLPFAIPSCAVFLMLMMRDDSKAADLMVDPAEIAKHGGGEAYDQELSHQIKEFYDLCQSQNLELRVLYADYFK